jgi:hypothetical protein
VSTYGALSARVLVRVRGLDVKIRVWRPRVLLPTRVVEWGVVTPRREASLRIHLYGLKVS